MRFHDRLSWYSSFINVLSMSLFRIHESFCAEQAVLIVDHHCGSLLDTHGSHRVYRIPRAYISLDDRQASIYPCRTLKSLLFDHDLEYTTHDKKMVNMSMPQRWWGSPYTTSGKNHYEEPRSFRRLIVWPSSSGSRRDQLDLLYMEHSTWQLSRFWQDAKPQALAASSAKLWPNVCEPDCSRGSWQIDLLTAHYISP